MSVGRIPGVRRGRVEDIYDENGADRIKVRLLPEDGPVKSKEELEYAIPLLPKFFYVKPKIGESVLILTAVANDGFSQRYYIGPVISQENKMLYEPFFAGSDSLYNGGAKGFDEYHKVEGAYKDDFDIVVSGRKNCDIQIREDDIRIRAGVKLVDDSDPKKITFNQDNPSYVKLKYHKDGVSGNRSTAAIVADKVAILSNNSVSKKNGNGKLNLHDKKDLITDEEMQKIIDNCYKIPYGEVLVDFMKKFIDIFISHTHDYSQLPPNKTYIDALNDAASDPIINGKMLSDTVRIN